MPNFNSSDPPSHAPKNEWKIDCKVNGKIDGLAHIIEQSFRGLFTFWYGAIELSSSPEEWLALSWKEIVVRLDDGRVGTAKVIKSKGELCSILTEDQTPGQFFLLCIVGFTALAIPVTSPLSPEI